MPNLFKKLFSLSLILCVLLTSFTGCSSSVKEQKVQEKAAGINLFSVETLTLPIVKEPLIIRFLLYYLFITIG